MSFATNGTTQYSEVASCPITAGPVTMMAWVKPASTTGGTPAALGRTANFDGFCLSLDASRRPYFEVLGSAGGTDIQASHATSCTTGAWSHIAGVSSSATSHTAYKDGVAGTTNTTSSIPASLNYMSIGCMFNWGGYLQFFNGSTAHVAVWSIALSGAEITSLAGGAVPTSVQPGSLVFYAPCDEVSSPTVDSVAARSLVWVASPVRDADNPTLSGGATAVPVVTPSFQAIPFMGSRP